MSTEEAAGQRERTRLAWRRTALTATVVFLLAARHAVSAPITPRRAAALALAVPAYLALLALAQRRVAAMSVSTGPVDAGAASRLAVTGGLAIGAVGATLAFAAVGVAMVVMRGG